VSRFLTALQHIIRPFSVIHGVYVRNYRQQKNKQLTQIRNGVIRGGAPIGAASWGS